ncbi:hypothetical protein [Sphingomonas jaspsi]|uniref:hypothetical protein n=1 Tax=Sphingomonas jaspsi TaxID=392409 RepID=UPI0004ADDDB0|nr:hypothetical protein [Sphingomonas jaspsi]
MLPVPWIAVGVTGHRHPRLPVANSDAVGDAITWCLTRIRDEAAALVAGDDDCLADAALHCRLVTSLAEGSDTIAANRALLAGYRIDACLPFERDEFARDFGAEALTAYRAALSSCRTVTELPGNRRDELGAYEAAGRMVLDQSDLLIAVWDGSPALGRGGTAEIVAEAVLAHVPVVIIDVDGALATMLWSGLDEAGHDRPTVEGVPRCAFDQCIGRVMQTLMSPPTNPLDLAMIGRWQRETDHRRSPALGYPILLAMVAGKPLSRPDFRPSTAADCRRPFDEWIAQLPDMGQLGGRLKQLVAPRFGRADASASYFAQLFRSGFIVNFAFAALAVLLGLMGLLVPHGKLYFAIAELGVIAVILANTRSARNRGWHERWMDNRHLAERLRVLALSAALGDPELRVGVDDAGSLPGWVQWMARATGRELGLPAGRIDQGYLERVKAAMLTLVDEQIAYNHRNARRMERVERRLHNFGELLFAVTVLACGSWIIAKLVRPDLMVGEGVGPTQFVTVATAFFPALGAAIYGIRMQGDFHGMAHRSETTARLLARLKRAIECDAPDYDIMKDRVKRLGDILLMDVEGWRTTYQARPLHLPG